MEVFLFMWDSLKESGHSLNIFSKLGNILLFCIQFVWCSPLMIDDEYTQIIY